MPLTIQIQIVLAMAASICGDAMLGAPGANREDHAMVVLVDAAMDAECVDADPIEPDGPTSDGILLDVAVWPLWFGSDIWDIAHLPSMGETARRWLPTRGPPLHIQA